MTDASMRLACPRCGYSTTDTSEQRCADCDSGLEVHYADFAARVAGFAWPPDMSATLAERYAAFLPASAREVPTLGEGETPLLDCRRLGERSGCAELRLANEGLNPTGSFKDRGTLVALGHALSLGATAVGTVSSGNMAASVAAYAARAGVPAVIVVSDGVPIEKLRAAGVYGPLLLRVEREHDRLYFDSREVGEELGVCFLNSDHPYRVEGQKTVVMDLYARLHPAEPTCIVVPLSSGGHFLSICKGLRGLLAAGLIRSAPKVVGVQPAGCAPIWNAYVRELPAVERVTEPDTIAGSIRNPFPPAGDRVLAALREEHPEIELAVTTVTDEEMVDAQRELAEHEGVWVQPDSAAAVAAIPKLVETGVVGERDRVVCVLTGGGHRDSGTPSQDAVVGGTISFDELPKRVAAFV